MIAMDVEEEKVHDAYHVLCLYIFKEISITKSSSYRECGSGASAIFSDPLFLVI